MKIILRRVGCFLLAFRWGAVNRAGPRWLEAWFPLLLYCSFLPEPVLAFFQPGRWVTAPHLPSGLEASMCSWAAALTVLAVLVPDWQEILPPPVFGGLFFWPLSYSIWILAFCFKNSSKEKYSFCTRHKGRVFYLVLLFRWLQETLNGSFQGMTPFFLVTVGRAWVSSASGPDF